MSTVPKLAAAALVGFALGHLPAADLAARVAGGDLRADGTGNPGAMNASHVLGKKWGVAVVVADVAKGALAARIGGRMAGPTGANLASSAAVAGHCFPIGRTGGKGVATSVGQVIGTFPAYLPVDVGVAVATSALPFFRQRTRVATTVASITWVTCSTLWWRRALPNPGGVTPTAALPIFAVVTSAIVAARFAEGATDVEAYNSTLEANGEVAT